MQIIVVIFCPTRIVEVSNGVILLMAMKENSRLDIIVTRIALQTIGVIYVALGTECRFSFKIYKLTFVPRTVCYFVLVLCWYETEFDIIKSRMDAKASGFRSRASVRTEQFQI